MTPSTLERAPYGSRRYIKIHYGWQKLPFCNMGLSPYQPIQLTTHWPEVTCQRCLHRRAKHG